jgi:putative acetyltransferase
MMHIRPETVADQQAIDDVNAEAFGRQAEADLVRRLRREGALLLSLVAERDGQLVGHIAFSRGQLARTGEMQDVVALGPMAVIPALQRKGIGSQLVRAGLDALGAAGHELIFVLGHPAYYPRFGFEPAQRYGIGCQFEAPAEAFMVCVRGDARLEGNAAGGIFIYHPAFEAV